MKNNPKPKPPVAQPKQAANPRDRLSEHDLQ